MSIEKLLINILYYLIIGMSIWFAFCIFYSIIAILFKEFKIHKYNPVTITKNIIKGIGYVAGYILGLAFIKIIILVIILLIGVIALFIGECSGPSESPIY